MPFFHRSFGECSALPAARIAPPAALGDLTDGANRAGRHPDPSGGTIRRQRRQEPSMTTLTTRSMTPTLIRAIALLAVVTALLLSVTARAGAQPNGDGGTAAGTGQVLLCQGGGGTATVDVPRTTDGPIYTAVRCHGGAFDGLYCENFGNTGETACSHLPEKRAPKSTAPGIGGGDRSS
jgi:hypothetical protein